MIHTVYVYSDGRVMAFDEDQDPIPAYQGKLADLREKILADAPPDAFFRNGMYGSDCVITREQFAAIGREPNQ